MKKITALFAAATITTSSLAGVFINGNYKGTFTDGNPGAASYAQDLDLTLVGEVSPGTSVTMTMENLTGGSVVTATTAFIETEIEGLNFKGGNYKSQNGSGLLQKKGLVTNQMQLSTSVGGASVAVNQVSGDGNATADVALDVAGVSLNAQNVANSNRFVTASADLGGLEVSVERQATTTGTNTAGAVTADLGAVTVTAVMVDVNDATNVTQDDGVLGDISDAVNGKDLNGVVVTTATVLGDVTGKYINKNDATTMVGKLKRGVVEYAYSKTENVDGVFSAEINVAF